MWAETQREKQKANFNDKKLDLFNLIFYASNFISTKKNYLKNLIYQIKTKYKQWASMFFFNVSAKCV